MSDETTSRTITETQAEPEASEPQAEPTAEVAAPESAAPESSSAEETTAPVAETPAPAAEAPAPVAAEAPAPVEDFATALETFTAESEASEARPDERVLTGIVVKIKSNYVVVDVGLKAEGQVPIAQLQDAEGNVRVKPGDEIPVMRDHGEHEEGYVLLSHEKAQKRKVWEDIEKAHKENLPVRGKVVERVKGGLAVDIGVRAFLPGSQVDVRPVRNLDRLLGQEMEVRVIKLNRKRGNVVVSRKQLLEEEVAGKRSQILEKLEEGAVLTGTVKNLTDYGAFVDLGGLDGLLHITDMSWGRLTHPRDLVHVADEIQVKVLKYDKEKQRVSLGFKQLTPDPWLDVAQRYPVGAHVKGRVISTTDYGCFLELEQGIEGLVHVSEMSWSKRTKHPSKLVKVNDQVEAQVLDVNPTDRRISLGLRQLAANPWDTLAEKYPVGTPVEGRVRNLTDFGAFIEVEDGIDGLVHVSDLSWTKRVKHPSEVLKKGDKVKAVVLAIDPKTRRMSLGVKQLQPDVWETFFAAHHVGDVMKGKVSRVAAFGAFVEIAEGVEGLCHNSEAKDERGAPLKLEPGQERDFKIVKMNQGEKKVGLSTQLAEKQASRAEVETHKETHKHSVSSATSTIEELMSLKRASNEQN
ncbi:MAG TPA: 30S ribosomal protein S1 [Terriglobales bacterium]|nr:30S ribosomal protein S1 [Terriglobales bacterium]